MKTWMILGGGGPFGIHLTRCLLRDNIRVVSVGRNPWPAGAYALGMDENQEHLRYEQIHIVNEQKRLHHLMLEEQPSIIINIAALAYATSWEDAGLYYRTNLVALAELTEWLTPKLWLDRFIQIGTSELYGSTSNPVRETATPRPSSPYAVSKLAADLHLQTLKRFPFVILRPSNCYCEAQRLYRLIPRAVWCAETGHKLPLQGGGIAQKSFMHVDDLVSAIMMVTERGEVGSIYNAGPDRPMTIREIVEAVARLANLALDDLIELARPRSFEDAVYWLNSDKIRDLGWSQTIVLESGIQRVQKWVKEWVPQLGSPKPFVLRA